MIWTDAILVSIRAIQKEEIRRVEVGKYAINIAQGIYRSRVGMRCSSYNSCKLTPGLVAQLELSHPPKQSLTPRKWTRTGSSLTDGHKSGKIVVPSIAGSA